MGKINLTPLSMRGQDMDNAQAIRRIESYLYQLNEELRYELTHIDEDNMAANNTTVYTVRANSSRSSGSEQINGETLDLNNNPLIMELKNTLSKLNDGYRSHKHSISIDSSGNLTMGGPTASPVFPNIAATQFFKTKMKQQYNNGWAAAMKKFVLATVRLQGERDRSAYTESDNEGDYYYKAGTRGTYYQSDGTDYTLQGSAHDPIIAIGNEVHFTRHNPTVQPTGLWYEAVASGGITYYAKGTTYNNLRNPGNKKISDKWTEKQVTPIDILTVKRFIPATRYYAGSEVTDTYYTKTP